MPARQSNSQKAAAAEQIVTTDDMHNTQAEGLESTSDVGEDEEDDIDSCSSFSLQQCIDEFRARRIRRNSNQEQQHQETENLEKADADLINQNRSNKEQERKCKPCKNGFCYCFTSDSGDGGCSGKASTIAARAANQLRHARRNRKSENGQQSSFVQPPAVTNNNKTKERKSAPACLKTITPSNEDNEKNEIHSPKKRNLQQTVVERRQLTAISRLETTTCDAPLIHIIQELRDNCVVSEVRVNKQKLQQSRNTIKEIKSPSKKSINMEKKVKDILSEPFAPLIEEISSSSSVVKDCKSAVLEMPSGDIIPVSRLEINAKTSRRHSGGGRLLQKRLSHTNLRYKPRDMLTPPPKPPRASTGSIMKSSSSTLSSTSPSIREAERIVDDFLKKKGVPIPRAVETLKRTDKVAKKLDKKRMSFPFTQIEEEEHFNPHMPSCPSLSDIERVVDTKPRSYYGKNIQQANEQPVKDINFGWKEPKVSEMLNYDTNGNRKDFKSQSANAEPQSLGWHVPPKLELDTVDGAVRHNLASNVATKDTPVKLQFNPMRKETYQKFGWRNLSPWSTTTMTANGARIRKYPKNTKTFLKQSKKKILRLVTPKKVNKAPTFQRQNTPIPYRTIGIQTSPNDFASYENSITPQSPPGSYHSAAPATITPQDSLATSTTGQQTQSNNQSDTVEFDFTRTVNSPPKKGTGRVTQRKLCYPTPCVEIDNGLNCGPATRTYRSFQTDLDQDVNISKMGFILSNIRARLEASDEQAVRTFEEIERREQLEQGFDCPDSFGIRQRTCVDIHSNLLNRSGQIATNEPIYSEIEEDSIRVSESPQFDNKTGIESSSSTAIIDLEALYAKVKKPKKLNTTHMPLGKFLHDSLRQKRNQAVHRLPILPEPSFSDVSYTSPAFETSTQRSATPTISHCQSLNNIRVMEYNSPPRQNRNLSKSDLSLQRSEIFLENLCRSELIVEGNTLERLEKINNNNNDLLNRRSESCEPDNVSYDLPDETDTNIAGSFLTKTAFSKPQKDATTISPPQKFLTKNTVESQATQTLTSNCNPIEIVLPSNQGNLYDSHCSSCPVTPLKKTNSQRQIMQTHSQPESLNTSKYDLETTLPQPADETGQSSTTAGRYKRFKRVLQNSFRKSRNFVKLKRPSTPFSPPVALNHDQTLNTTETFSQAATESCLNLDALFALDEATNITEQIVRAVSICRKLPELETSREMVEAERLLLFSTLQQDTRQQQMKIRPSIKDTLQRHFSIGSMHLPVNLEANLESYFNYYFIVTFECEGKIHSTQSSVCRRSQAVFRDCNIEFKIQKTLNGPEPIINCNIFMLRLRKVTTTANLSMETQDLSTSGTGHDITPLSSTPFGSLTSLNGITSRFRLYGAFSLNAQTFAPYTLIISELSQPDRISLGSTNNCYVPLKICARETQISINASVMLHFPQIKYSGFLHVQDPFSLHNWNWRWCNLIGLQLQVWTDMNGITEEPLLRLDLYGDGQSLPLQSCPRELCARARSFCLQCSTRKIGLEAAMAAVFFAADSESDLEQWLQHLNEVLHFIVKWMQ